MRPTGLLVALAGLVILMAAALDHFSFHFTRGLSHGSVIVAVVGALLLAVGAFILMPRSAQSQ